MSNGDNKYIPGGNLSRGQDKLGHLYPWGNLSRGQDKLGHRKLNENWLKTEEVEEKKKAEFRKTDLDMKVTLKRENHIL